MKKIFLLCLALLSGCEKKEYPKTSAVSIAKVIQQDVPYILKSSGTLTASKTVDIKPQVDGMLTGVFFEDGALVEEGDLLFKIDSRSYEASFQAAAAQLEQDRAKFKFALDFAKTYGNLVEKEYVSRLSYEEGMQNVNVYKAAVELDLSALKMAEIDLGFTEIRAPFKGYVGVKKCDCGSYLDPYQNETLVTIHQITPLHVKFQVSSEHVNAIRQCQKNGSIVLAATLQSDPCHPLCGSLYCIDNNVTAETGMLLLKGSLPNTEEKGWPGQLVNVSLHLKTFENALLVPQTAIRTGESGYFVYTVDEKTRTVTKKMVGKGINYQDLTVIEWGLKGDESVVTDKDASLIDGAKIYSQVSKCCKK